ncbi:unnamed protein product, partial [Closterium sp. NIES-53]
QLFSFQYLPHHTPHHPAFLPLLLPACLAPPFATPHSAMTASPLVRAPPSRHPTPLPARAFPPSPARPRNTRPPLPSRAQPRRHSPLRACADGGGFRPPAREEREQVQRAEHGGAHQREVPHAARGTRGAHRSPRGAGPRVRRHFARNGHGAERLLVAR